MKTLFFWASVVVAAYAVDLNKLLLSVSAFLMGKPLAFSEFGRLSDILCAALCTCLTLAVVLFTKRKPMHVYFYGPLVLMTFLGLLMTLSLLQSADGESIENYGRFMAGNMVLFFGALVGCQSTENGKRIWLIWGIGCLVLAIISLYLACIGLMWTSGRNALFPATAIRTGYGCALTVIYWTTSILLDPSCRHKVLKVGGIGICILGVLLSGSKASLLLMVGALVVILLMQIQTTGYVKAAPALGVLFAVVFITVIVIVLVTGLEKSGGESGYLGGLHQADSYATSVYERLRLSKAYIQLGLQRPFLGKGISAAYSLELRTHSLLVALFVQVGLFGVLAYILFLTSLLHMAYQRIKTCWRQFATCPDISVAIATFVAVIFLALKAEVTGDIPGNRELWFFAGLLLALCRPAYVNREEQIALQPIEWS